MREGLHQSSALRCVIAPIGGSFIWWDNPFHLGLVYSGTARNPILDNQECKEFHFFGRSLHEGIEPGHQTAKFVILGAADLPLD